MDRFLEKFYEHVKKSPELTAVVDQSGQRRTSYRELDELSGRIASMLRKRAIGREDVVAICVPRGVEFIAVRIGVMKVGAAWVGTETMMGEDRIRYIIKDSGSVLVIDEDTYEQAMGEDRLPMEEWSDPDPHDLAFIYYTSGSTGRPKGVAQEYGIYKYIMASTDRAIGRWIPLDYANVAPETFIGGIYLMIGTLQAGCTLHLVPLPLVRDPAGLLKYFSEQEVTGTCMPPTLVKVLESAGGFDVKVLHVTGEIVTDLYIDRFPMLNAYGPTEFSYLAFFFDIDGPYSNTPIGSPDKDTKVILIDENGEVNEKEGMLCIHLPFFRGYLHEKERTELIYSGGEPYYKSGDYMSVDGKGNYTLLGRVDDMVNINGNRIEPAEVESAVKKVLNTGYAAVKVWERGGSRYLCAYHTTGQELDAARMAELLKNMLPDYMIPTCYVNLKELPLNENGKVNKLALPEPEEDILHAAYVKPLNEAQEKLCSGFSSALGIEKEKIGIDDDFFLLGGDSVKAIQLIVDTGDERLSVPLIYRERTVRNIDNALSHIESKVETVSPGDEDPDGRDTGKPYPLTREQKYFLDQQIKIPDRMIYNLPVLLSFNPDVDEKQLEKAVVTAFAAHPALLTVIKETPDGWRQVYFPENNITPETDKASEEELEGMMNDFVKPFAFDGSPLFHRRLVRTDRRLVLFLDIHHIICDGTSFRILVEDILSAYEGRSITKDPYFALLKDQLDYAASESFKKDREYFENNYTGEYVRLPEADLTGMDTVEGTVDHMPGFTRDEITGAAKRLHLSVTAFYMLPAMLALASYNAADKVMISWNYHGRSDIRTMRSVGLFIRDYPVGLHLKRDDTVGRVSAELSRQIRKSILHGRMSPFMDRKKGELLCFLYQGGLMNIPDSELILDADFPDVTGQAAIEPIELKVGEDEDGIRVEISYDAGMYSYESMERFDKIYEDICGLLLEEGSRDLLISDIVPVVFDEENDL